MRKLLLYLAIASVTFVAGSSTTVLRNSHYRAVQSAAPDAVSKVEKTYTCDRNPVLPIGVKKLLDRNFPGWQFHPTTQEDCETVKSQGGKYAYSQMIMGDFDGDLRSDYAVLIDGDPDAMYRPGVYIIAFLARENSYSMVVVTREGGDCLLLMPKRTSDFNYDAQCEFSYANDAIFSGMGMGGMSYLYENGKFRAIITAD